MSLYIVAVACCSSRYAAMQPFVVGIAPWRSHSQLDLQNAHCGCFTYRWFHSTHPHSASAALGARSKTATASSMIVRLNPRRTHAVAHPRAYRVRQGTSHTRAIIPNIFRRAVQAWASTTAQYALATCTSGSSLSPVKSSGYFTGRGMMPSGYRPLGKRMFSTAPLGKVTDLMSSHLTFGLPSSAFSCSHVFLYAVSTAFCDSGGILSINAASWNVSLAVGQNRTMRPTTGT